MRATYHFGRFCAAHALLLAALICVAVWVQNARQDVAHDDEPVEITILAS